MSARIVSSRELASGRWIRLLEVEYQKSDDDSEPKFKWEMTERTTRRSEAEADGTRPSKPLYFTPSGVDIIAVLEAKPVPKVILVSQFRPPTGSYCLEFPAGLITEPNEDASQTAQRELKEETGYYAYSIQVFSPSLMLDPGISNCTTKLVLARIDPEDYRNQDPQTDFQDEECIQVHTLPFNENLYESAVELCQKEGFSICSRLASFALGLKICSEISRPRQ